MTLVTCVFRRGSTFHFRTRVPPELIAAVGRRELWRSLRTAEEKVARRRGGLLLSLTPALWDAVRSAMTPSDAQTLVDQWLQRKLDEDMQIRRLPRTPSEGLVALKRTEPWMADEVVRRINEDEVQRIALNGGKFEAQLANGVVWSRDTSERAIAQNGFRKPLEPAAMMLDLDDPSIAEPTVRALCKDMGLTVSADDPAFQAAVRAMMVAQRDLLLAVKRRDDANWFYRPSAPGADPAQPLLDRLTRSLAPPPPPRVENPVTPAASPDPEPSAGESLRTVADAFLEAESRSDQSEGRIEEEKNAIDRFIEWLGRDPEFASITSRQAGDFQILLSRMPSNGSKKSLYRDLPFAARADEAARIGETALLSIATINGKYLDPLRSLFTWGQNTGKISSNPFVGIKLARRGKRAQTVKRREDFTPEQLESLFGQPVFRGAAGHQGHRG